MKLAVFADQIFWFDGERYSTDEAFIKFITSFSIYFEEITIIARVSDDRKVEKYVINDPMIRICALPFYKDIYTLYKYGFIFFPRIYRLISQNILKWDILWLPFAHPISWIAIFLAKYHKIRFFCTIRGDHVKDMKYRYGGIKKLAALTTAKINDYLFPLMIKDIPIFVAGNSLYSRYKGISNLVFKMFPTLVSKKNIRLQCNHITPLKKALKLLYVGRLEPEKGVEYLIEALDRLRKTEGIEFHLDIVGSGPDRNILKKKKEESGVNRYVIFFGHIPSGPNLFEIYERSDIFVLPSLTEGAPQVLYEAMAKGLPIIATAVGGVPDIIKDGENGLLIPPANPEAIAEAILYLINDEELRIKLIKNALETVKEFTLEKQTHKMVSILQSHFGLELKS